MTKFKLTDDQLTALHERHAHPTRGETATALAAEYGVSITTLTKGWARLGLPVLRGGKAGQPEDDAAPAPTAVAATAAYEVVEPIDDGDDAWFASIQTRHTGRDDDLRATDTGAAWSGAGLGDEPAGEAVALPFISDPSGLEEIWLRANGHRPAAPAGLTLEELLAPPITVAVVAGWIGRMRAVREDLRQMGLTVEGTISVSLDL